MTTAFVNTAAIYGDSPRTVNTANMPASIVPGNLLIAWVQVNSDQANLTANGSTAPNWRIGGLRHAAGQSFGWLWKIAGAGGSDVVGGFTWTDPATYHASIFQLTGNLADARAIGRRSYARGNSALVSSAGLQVSSPNSLVVAMMFAVGNHQIALPSGFTSGDEYHDSGGSHRIAYANGPGRNAVSGAVSAALSSAVWDVAMIEFRSAAARGNGGALL